MPAHLKDLGFPVDDEHALQALVQEAAAAGTTVPAPHGAYVRWTPGEGIELWVGLGPGGHICGYTPYFAGRSTMTVQVADLLRRPGEPLAGSLYAWTSPGTRGATFEGPPLILELPDLDLIAPALNCPAIAAIQVAAFAHAAECFADESAFRRWQEGHRQPAAPALFVPCGAFARPARSEAAFAGHIEQARLRVNPASGRPFHHLVVRTQVGTLDVVAAPDNLDGRPEVGGMVQGYFWLSARVKSLSDRCSAASERRSD